MSSSVCEHIRAQLPLFVGDDLPAAALQRIRLHLRDCHHCRGEASGLLQARRVLTRAMTGPVPGEGFFADLQRDIVARVAAQPAPTAVAAPRWVGWRWLAAAGVLLAGVLAWPSREAGLLGRPPIRSTGVVAQPYAGASARPMVPLGHDVIFDSRSRGMRGRDELRALAEDVPFGLPTEPVSGWAQAGVAAARAGAVAGTWR